MSPKAVTPILMPAPSLTAGELVDWLQKFPRETPIKLWLKEGGRDRFVLAERATHAKGDGARAEDLGTVYVVGKA